MSTIKAGDRVRIEDYSSGYNGLTGTVMSNELDYSDRFTVYMDEGFNCYFHPDYLHVIPSHSFMSGAVVSIDGRPGQVLQGTLIVDGKVIPTPPIRKGTVGVICYDAHTCNYYEPSMQCRVKTDEYPDGIWIDTDYLNVVVANF